MTRNDGRAAEATAWLEDARLRLTVARVAAPVRDELLAEARDLLDQSGESPSDLFGPPREWVDEQLADRRARGVPTVTAEPVASWRDVPVLGLYLATALALVLLVVGLVQDGWDVESDLGLLALPVLGGLLVTTALATWEKTLARRPVGVAVAAGGGVLLGGSLLTGLLLMWTSEQPWPQAGAWHLVGLVLACALVGKGLDRVLPAQQRTSWRAPRDDDEWLAALAGVLRLRADVPEERVRSILAEARAHASEAGSTLAAEFGRPEDYASAFPVDHSSGIRLRAWGLSAMTALSTFLAVPPDGSWAWALMTVLWGSLAVREWRRLRRALDSTQRLRHSPGDGSHPR